MDCFLNNLSLVNKRPDLVQNIELNFKLLNILFFLTKNLTNIPVALVIFRGQKIKWVTIPSNSCCPSAPVHINFSVERTLIMNNIAYVWDIKSSRSNISAYQYGSIFGICSRFDLVYSSLEAVKILESLLLLHFGVEAVVLDLQKVQKTVEATSCGDGVAEYDYWFAFFLLKEVIEVEVFLFVLTSDSGFLEGWGHCWCSWFCSQIYYFWVFGSELQSCAERT